MLISAPSRMRRGPSLGSSTTADISSLCRGTLATVFSFYLAGMGTPLAGPIPSALLLAHVCSEWKRVTMLPAYRSFWSNIVVVNPQPFDFHLVKHSITLSGDLPLTVAFGAHQIMNRSGVTWATLQKLMKGASRWKNLSLNVVGTNLPQLPSLPSLECCDLGLTGAWHVDDIQNLCTSILRSPSLRTFIFQSPLPLPHECSPDLTTDLSCPDWSRLQSLQFHHTHDDNHLAQILSHCTSLESLHIRPVPPEHALPSAEAIRIPNLRTLHLGPLEYRNTFLSRLDTPNLRALVISPGGARGVLGRDILLDFIDRVSKTSKLKSLAWCEVKDYPSPELLVDFFYHPSICDDLEELELQMPISDTFIEALRGPTQLPPNWRRIPIDRRFIGQPPPHNSPLLPQLKKLRLSGAAMVRCSPDQLGSLAKVRFGYKAGIGREALQQLVFQRLGPSATTPKRHPIGRPGSAGVLNERQDKEKLEAWLRDIDGVSFEAVEVHTDRAGGWLFTVTADRVGEL
ncbi:hypothetical protein DFP72DRAFT_353015 [Ephemerocybe angulata]|uniref:F-box domain-containing protein n=1 Tax=Ephemerocybe angulata TaxID=980116 RepID=A0A8H6HYU6_9AGAR|nr:hypothetical protein DFP72DRAFT_353015 [Tulosesus angulatus]